MDAINDVLNQIPMDQLAAQLGTDTATADQAARRAIALLLGGMQHNATNPEGEASLAGALTQHQNSPFKDVKAVDLDQVDTEDGGKIVSHVFGNQDPAPAVDQNGILGSDMVKQLMKILAPIVLSYLAKQISSGEYGDVLGQILGGGQQAQTQPSSGGGLGDILGQILVGSQQSSGGLGEVLGQVLGGSQQTSSTTSSDSPFNTPNSGQQQTFPTQQTTTQQSQNPGGVLGDILGGLFGKK